MAIMPGKTAAGMLLITDSDVPETACHYGYIYTLIPQENANSQYVATGGKQYVLMPPQDYWNGAVSAAD